MAMDVTFRLRSAVVPLLAVLLGAAGVATAQQGTVTGRVTDTITMQPIAGAQVFLVGTTRRVFTGQDGTYRLDNVTAGQVDVRVVAIGYGAATRSVRSEERRVGKEC